MITKIISFAKISTILVLFIGCVREKNDIGTIKRYYEWTCLKKRTDVGIGVGHGGGTSTVIISNCTVEKCFYYEKKIGRFFWNDIIMSSKMVDDINCIEVNNE